jgi:hypothetical protein
MTDLNPADWGHRPLSGFIRTANDNTARVFQTQPKNAARWEELDGIFLKVAESLVNSLEVLPNFLFWRAHSALRASIRLTTAGQVYESYAVLRNCLEAGLYALHVFRKPEDAQLWLDRDQSEESRKRMREAFKIGTLLEEVGATDTSLGDSVRQLYQATIEMGAHPNPRGVISMAEWVHDKDGVTYNGVYLTNSPALIGASLTTLAKVALVTLRLFRNVHPQRFDIVGATSDVDRLWRLVFRS